MRCSGGDARYLVLISELGANRGAALAGAWAMTDLQEQANPATASGEQQPGAQPGAFDPANQFDDASLQDPRSYRAFVESLIGRIESRLTAKLDDNVQAEIANLMRLLATMPRTTVAASRVYFELAFDILAAEQPNLLLARSIRMELAAINDRTSHGITRYISYICGNTSLNAALSGFISALSWHFYYFG